MFIRPSCTSIASNPSCSAFEMLVNYVWEPGNVHFDSFYDLMRERTIHYEIVKIIIFCVCIIT